MQPRVHLLAPRPVPSAAPQTAMPAINWIPCPSKNPACLQLDTSNALTWSQDGTSGTNPRFTYARTSPKHDYAVIVHYIKAPDIGQAFEVDIYTMPQFAPVQAFLHPESDSCSVLPLFGPTQGAFLQNYPVVDKLATGAMPSVFQSPVFASVNPAIGPGDTPANFVMSDTTIAFDLLPSNRVARLPMGQSTYAITKGVNVREPAVVGDDVFGENEYGTDGWSRILRVNPDGSTTPFRAAPQRHMSAFRAGPTWVAWLETYGDPNWQNFDQPNTELWAAPYTNDPTVLATTAKKIADLPGVRTGFPEPRYSDGFYAARGVLPNLVPVLYVVRLSDGFVKKLDVDATIGPDGAKPYYLDLSGVSGTEVFGVLNHLNGIPYFGVARIQLGPWP